MVVPLARILACVARGLALTNKPVLDCRGVVGTLGSFVRAAAGILQSVV
jgi:hypothetical protein